MMNNNIIFASIGVLLVSCVYLLYVNHQLKKQHKLLERKLRLASAGMPDEAAVAVAVAAATASAESEMNSAAEAVVAEVNAVAEAGTNVESGDNLREKYQEYQDNMDYYIDESIPDDLKREIDNLEQEDEGEDEDEEVVAEEAAAYEEEEVPVDEEEVAAEEEAAAEEAVYDMNAIIQAQINEINAAAKEAEPEAEPEPEAEADPVDEPEAASAETLQKLTMKQLKDLAREKGIKTSGKKDELIERLSV